MTIVVAVLPVTAQMKRLQEPLSVLTAMKLPETKWEEARREDY